MVHNSLCKTVRDDMIDLDSIYFHFNNLTHVATVKLDRKTKILLFGEIK